MELFISGEPFDLESGATLPSITIAYHTYGRLNSARNNVTWICHALTANSDPVQWWPALLVDHPTIDLEKNFIICANILGSCYGTTGPLSIDPLTGNPYFKSFPAITVRDMVRAHELLAKHLDIKGIDLLIGGSMGGYQALEWCVMGPDLINKLFIITTSAKESAWGVAIHTAQRLAIEADDTFGEPHPDAGKRGLIAARAIGMLTYRNYITYQKMQSDTDDSKIDNFKAESYIEYQGNKLANRFNAYSYWLLTKAMDSHNIARRRGLTLAGVLQSIKQKTLVIGIRTDILCPVREQVFIADNLMDATYIEIDSDYGHDGFLVEGRLISEALVQWMRST